jgi:SAM-dependent methyltransferase
VYGTCESCGHGCLLSEPAPLNTYDGADYFRGGAAGGVGYRDYCDERIYRENKGRTLLTWLTQSLGRRPRSALEVGSGYGFTRKAFQEEGVATHGVDLNPYAAAEAHRLYGMATTVGTLEDALADGDDPTVRVGPWDVILYQFVLEHLADPVAELRHATAVLAPDGVVVLVVPSMEATEVRIFGASYRSLRADHLQLFSRASLRRCLERAGLAEEAFKSDCALHLLRGFVGATGVDEIYRAGRGPDLFVVAGRGA